ncbi:MAG: hflK [Gammaproteobacteria bacterium]|jgi:membrane protease subunit HflK|nr:hflK [Gammaproteobacteria bacterium]
MPWNEPGGSGKNTDPWNGKKEPKPPDLDKFLRDLIKKLRFFFVHKTGNLSWQPSLNHELRFVVGIVMAIVLATWILSGLFIVNPAEEAVILRFGQYSDTVQPGLHWFARFIDTKYLLDVQKIYSFSLQGDFITKSSDQNDLPSPINTAKKIIELSDQSKNLVNVELNVQYRINDPRAYLFNIVDPDATIKAVASGALSDMVGQMKLDEVLTTGREMLSSGILGRVKQVLASYNAGLEVITVTLRKVQAPDQVRAAFSDVNRADQDKATYVQQAQAYASKVVPIAQGMAARILADANAYQQQVVLRAQANIAKYQAIVKVYTGAPDITRERMYLETMQTVLQNTSKVLIDANATNNLIYLPLDKLVNKNIVKINPGAQVNLPTIASRHHIAENNASHTTDVEVKNEAN